jgi:uncharacterized protein YqeY
LTKYVIIDAININIMSTQSDLRITLKESMKAKDEVRLRTVRSIMTACTNELVATARTPQDELRNEEVTSVIKRLAKQRKESITQYEAAGRPELAVPEKEELVILEAYLPTLMSKEEILPIAKQVKDELGVTDKTKTGQLVGAVMKKLQGQADGGDVKEVVESLF